MRYEQFTTFEAACKDQGLDPATAIPDFSKSSLSEKQKDYHTAAMKLDIIAVSVNKDEDDNEWKPKVGELRRYLWFNIIEDNTRPLGFRLSFHACAFDLSIACVASRLCFRDRQRIEFMFDKFPELFEKLYILNF